MTSHQIDILILASLTAVTCALPGVFLVLRRVALMSDAISHAILLGIVIAFFITKNLASPWLIVGAAVVGVLTVVLTELLIQTQKIKKDAAIGLVFPLLFSIGVILLMLYAKNVHLDADCVLFGEIAFAPFNRWIVGDVDLGPLGFWTIGGSLVLNILFITIFYKELKLATFDSGLATSLGFSPIFINYALMTIVSITAVAAFESVGSILVVALMIAPPAAAYLLTNRLSIMIVLSVIIGIGSALGGYGMAYRLDASISGAMATFSGILFLIILIAAPERGLLAKFFVRRFKKWTFASETLAVHLLHHEMNPEEEFENIVEHMKEHMMWEDEFTQQVIVQGAQDGWFKRDGNRLILTPLGREKAKTSMIRN